MTTLAVSPPSDVLTGIPGVLAEKIFLEILKTTSECNDEQKETLKAGFENDYKSFESKVLKISRASIASAKENKKWHIFATDNTEKTVEAVLSKSPILQQEFRKLETKYGKVFDRLPSVAALQKAAKAILGRVDFDTISHMEDVPLAQVVELGTKLDRIACTNNVLGLTAKCLKDQERCVTLAAVELLFRMRNPNSQTSLPVLKLFKLAQDFMKMNLEKKPDECGDLFKISTDTKKPGVPLVMATLGLMSNPLCLTPNWKAMDSVIREAVGIDLAQEKKGVAADQKVDSECFDSRVEAVLSLLIGLAVHYSYIDNHSDLTKDKRVIIHNALNGTRERIHTIFNMMNLRNRGPAVLYLVKQWLPDKAHHHVEGWIKENGWRGALMPRLAKICYEQSQGCDPDALAARWDKKFIAQKRKSKTAEKQKMVPKRTAEPADNSTRISKKFRSDRWMF